MEAFQQLFSVAIVLGLLLFFAGWARRRGFVRMGGIASSIRKGQLQSLDRLILSPQHSLHLVRVNQRVILVALSPGGCSVLETPETGMTSLDCADIRGVQCAGERS